LSQPPEIKDSLKKANITCHNDNNGKTKVFPYGGSSPYTYLWSNGNTRAGMSGLSAGIYSCTITDNNGCSITIGETIINPLALGVSLSSSAVKCFGGNTGSASITTLSGGTSPFTYSWAPGGETTSHLTGASAGTYTLIVTDHNGCTITASVTVTQPAKIRDSITNIGCGTATVGVRGGTPSYAYHWTPTGGFSATAIVYSVGIYTVTITDRNGCTASTTANITCPIIKQEEISSDKDLGVCCDKDIVVYPNPNNGQFTIQIENGEWKVENGKAEIQIYNVLGQKVYGSQFSTHNSQFSIHLTQPNGVYLYRIIAEDSNLQGEGKIVIQK
jgi:hypothetical protein